MVPIYEVNGLSSVEMFLSLYIGSIWKLNSEYRYNTLIFIDWDTILCDDGQLVNIDTENNLNYLMNELRLNYKRII